MILYLGQEVIKMFYPGKSDGGLNIYSNLSKTIIEGISNARWISDCFIIIVLLIDYLAK